GRTADRDALGIGSGGRDADLALGTGGLGQVRGHPGYRIPQQPSFSAALVSRSRATSTPPSQRMTALRIENAICWSVAYSDSVYSEPGFRGTWLGADAAHVPTMIVVAMTVSRRTIENPPPDCSCFPVRLRLWRWPTQDFSPARGEQSARTATRGR